MSGSPTQRAKSEAIHFAMSMAKRPKFAGGGVVGPLIGTDGGRSDTLPISVPAGAYVIPADVVSGVPGAEGNTLAGHTILDRMFASMPYSVPKGPRGVAMPGLKPKPRALPRKKGGVVPHHEHAEPVQIMAAAGEHVVPPEVVRQIGGGDEKRGHAILDAFVEHVRKENIKTLKKLPGPVKR